jgi:hypothetical protein
MIEPLASSLISVLRGTLHLVERSTYIKSNSPALENLREDVYETIAELEAASKRESKKNTSKFPAAESLNVECPKATQRTPRHSPRVPELQTRYARTVFLSQQSVPRVANRCRKAHRHNEPN